MSPEEGALLSQYASERDAEAFRTLVERHQRMVYGACFRVLGNAADAEDAAQDAFLQLARHAGRLRAPIAAWLHKVAVRAALATARKERRHRVKAGHAMAANTKRTEPTWDDMKEYVDEAIAALPEKQRQTIVLHFLEGRRQEDAAREIGLSQSGLSRRIQSGVKALRTHLARKGVVVSVAALAGILGANAAEAAVPLTLTAALGKMALAGPTTLKGAILMKISAITVVTAAAVTAGVLALNSGAEQPPAPTLPAAISQPAPPSGVVAPRFDRTVPEWTPEGMAKGAGTALITLAGLVEKLDGAVTEGDEIRVPGWTEDDSRKMIMAIHDIVGAGMFIGATSPVVASGSPPAEWLALLDSPDRATRIGAAVLLKNWFARPGAAERNVDPILSRAELMMKDADPYVRAAAVFMLFGISEATDRQWHPLISRAFADPAPCVRFAAGFTAMSFDLDRYAHEYQRLSTDSFAGSRYVASVFHARKRSVDGHYADPAWVKAVLSRERNPIVRLAILVGYIQMFAQKPEFGVEMAEFLSGNEDAWLRSVSAPFMPLIRREGMPDMKGIIDLLNSGKPSHEVVGLITLLYLHIISVAAPEQAPFVSEVSASLKANPLTQGVGPQESGSLWRRYAIAVVRRHSTDTADDGLRESLCSPDEVMRVASLFGAMASKKGEVVRATLDQLAALSESPLLVEGYAARSAMVRNLSENELLDQLSKAVTDAPDAPGTRLLLSTAASQRVLGSEGNAFRERVGKIFAESRNAELQAYALVTYFAAGQCGDARNSTIDVLVKEMELDALRIVLQEGFPHERMMGTQAVASPVMERLTAMFSSEDANARSLAFAVVPHFLLNVNRYTHRNKGKDDILLCGLLDSAVTAWNADKENYMSAILDTLNVIFSYTPQPIFPWPETWPVLRGAMVELLSYANHEKYGSSVAELLGSFYGSHSRSMYVAGKTIPAEENSISAVDAVLWNAMESARWRIMEGGTARDRVVVMMGMTRPGNGRTERAILREIGKMLAERSVPQDLVLEAVARVAVYMHEMPVECQEIALEIARRDDLDRDMERLLVSGVGSGARSARKDFPEWADEVARLGWAKATDEMLSLDQRKDWLRMHGRAVQDPTGRVRQLILDANQPLWLREAIAEVLPDIDSRSSLYQDLLPIPDQLATEVRLALAKSAVRSSNAPGGEDFWISVITDKNIPANLRAATLSGYYVLPWRTDKIREVLTKLQEYPAMRACASQMLERMN